VFDKECKAGALLLEWGALRVPGRETAITAVGYQTKRFHMSLARMAWLPGNV